MTASAWGSDVSGARLCQRRRLTWAETDASGHQHFSAAVRWLEEAEQALWRGLGLVEFVRRVPRVHLVINYRRPLWFDEELVVTVGVVSVGVTSCRLSFEVRTADTDVLAVTGEYVVAHAPEVTAGAQPWPDAVRARLTDPALMFG